MTKKHFEAIALQLSQAVGSAERQGDDDALVILSNLIERMAYSFEDFNPNFDKDRFRKATGINEATKELF